MVGLKLKILFNWNNLIPRPLAKYLTTYNNILYFRSGPVFGVSLETAVERSRLPDKVELPRIVRECIMYVEEKG